VSKKAAMPLKNKAIAKKVVAKKAAVPKKKQLTIMVSSTVFGAQSDLKQICGILKGYGYKVVMSMEGTVYVPIGVSNEEACLQAVQDCDLFLGIIFPRYGSGITHKEFSKAIDIDAPRWFISHQYVTFARDILKQYMFRGKRRNRQFKFKKTDIMDKADVIHMYNEAIQNHIASDKRRSHWAQPFFNSSDIFPFLKEQFGDMEKRVKELEAFKKKKK
jgi:hypothetical protein